MKQSAPIAAKKRSRSCCSISTISSSSTTFYGHHAGDLLLCEVARILQQMLRRMDLVARIGGEEFVALLPQTEQAEAQRIAERLRQEIQVSQVPFGRSQLSVTASIGVAMWQGNGDEWEALLQRADAGMYLAKGAGRNRVESVAS